MGRATGRAGERLSSALASHTAVLKTRAGRLVALIVLAVALATAVALVALWPPAVNPRSSGIVIRSRDIADAKVTSVAQASCPVESKPGCERVGIRVSSGAARGRNAFLMLPGDEATPRISPGDAIRVTPSVQGYGNVSATRLAALEPGQPWSFVDFQRGPPLAVLALLFALLVVALGRRTGAASLVAVAIGLLLLTAFVVPAILAGSSPVAVALVGSFAAMFATIVLVYGIGAKSLAALLGTIVSLLATGALAVIFVHAAHITGTSSEEATLILSLGGGRVSLQGLVLAGMVIAALGVLSDVTVSQSSTVMALRRANPGQRAAQLYRGAVDVGRDHLGATVNTLVFAYAGASLPLLLIFKSQAVNFGDAINREAVATEVVAALVGSIGLVLAVPLTTAVAALLAARLPTDALEDSHHGHVH
jgi:uncharacterized membrane protein